MSYYDDLTEGVDLIPVTFRGKTELFDPDLGAYKNVYGDLFTEDTIVFFKSSVRRYVASQFSDDTVAVVLFNPESANLSSVDKDGTIKFNGREYQIIQFDDVAYQGELVVISLKSKGPRNAE